MLLNKFKPEPTILTAEQSKWLLSRLAQVDTSPERIAKLRAEARERLQTILKK